MFVTGQIGGRAIWRPVLSDSIGTGWPCYLTIVTATTDTQWGMFTLRVWLLGLAAGHNPSGLHAAYRTTRALFRWFEAEMEKTAWLSLNLLDATSRVVR